MNAFKLAVGTLVGLLTHVGSTFAVGVAAAVAPLPVEDGGLLMVAAVGLAAAIKIARWKQKR